jgi:hypothetical protein
VGTWSRPRANVSGEFRVTAAGVFELRDIAGNVMARATMPSGWSSSL